MKTSELIGPTLDWAVAKADGATNLHHDTVSSWWFTLGGKERTLNKSWAQAFNPSTDWSHGGPIVEREKLNLDIDDSSLWLSYTSEGTLKQFGPTPLIAAMRCYVTSKLGDEVEIPEDLK